MVVTPELSSSRARQAVALPKRILLVDDHQVVRQGTRAILSNARPNWEICGEAASGQEAMEAVKKLAPDVVVLDITMPGMNGFEVARRIKELGLMTRIVIFSMHDSAGFIAEARNAGADGYVLKSQASRDMVKTIERVLAGDTAFPADAGGVET